MSGDAIWTWTTRICAVTVLVYLMVYVGFEKTPTWAFILLIGLFFGPEALKGQINILGTKRTNGKEP